MFFLRNLMDYLPTPLQMRRGAGSSGGADHHRDIVFHAGHDHIAQIAFHPGPVGKGFARPQVVGARIG